MNRHFINFVIDTYEYYCIHDSLPHKGCAQCHVTSLNVGEISDNVSEMVQDRDIVAWKINMKVYVAYQMAPLLVTLNDLEGHFCCLKPL